MHLPYPKKHIFISHAVTSLAGYMMGPLPTHPNGSIDPHPSFETERKLTRLLLKFCNLIDLKTWYHQPGNSTRTCGIPDHKEPSGGLGHNGAYDPQWIIDDSIICNILICWWLQQDREKKKKSTPNVLWNPRPNFLVLRLGHSILTYATEQAASFHTVIL